MVIPAASDIVVLDVGGRKYKTTVSTLVTSGSFFFEGMFGSTGMALSRGAGNDDVDDTNSEQTSVVFIDRDPDIFEDVLYFMRTKKIHPKTESNSDRLECLQNEADFLAMDSLMQACDEAVRTPNNILDGCEAFHLQLEPNTSDRSGLGVPLALEGSELLMVQSITFPKTLVGEFLLEYAPSGPNLVVDKSDKKKVHKPSLYRCNAYGEAPKRIRLQHDLWTVFAPPPGTESVTFSCWNVCTNAPQGCTVFGWKGSKAAILKMNMTAQQGKATV